jgi:hypothetical protein
MVKVRQDLTGQIFGRLTVLEQTEDYVDCSGRHYAQWLCQCDCESHTIKKIVGNDLKQGKISSCGCVRKEVTGQRGKNHHKTNKYDLSGEYGVGWTFNTNQEFYFDLDDYEKIKDYCWYVNVSNNYSRLVAYQGRFKRVSILGILGCSNYDHINRNPLDNRKHNLRPATHAENSRNQSLRTNNTSGVTGVSRSKSISKWIAEIRINKEHFYLGSFANKDDAIRARLNAEVKYFGEFAPQRHLYEQYGIKEIEE